MGTNQAGLSIRLRSDTMWRFILVNNMSQTDLAQRLGITQPQLSQLMQHHRGPSPKVRLRILEVMAPLTFDELFIIKKDDNAA